MTIIAVIVIIAVLFYQNGRIHKLESLINMKPSKDGSFKADQTQESEIRSMQDQPIQTEGPTMSGSAPSAPSPLPVRSQASDEEMSGKILGRIGIGALVIGVGFFLKYAFDNDWIGPAGRVFIGIAFGVVLMSIGQRLRSKYLGYSDLLMGGGLAIAYLSIYASYGLYGLTDPITTFLAMAVVTGVGVGISVMNATQTLAVVAVVGGYAAPAFIGAGLIGPWIIFTYLTILNGGILGVLIYRKWSPLILLGLIGTWIHFGSWLATSYGDELLIPTLLFILVQFLIFTGASIVRVIVEKRTAESVDYLTLAITALTFAAASYSLLMPQYKHFVSLGAIVVAAMYGAIALVAYKENPQDRSINIFLPGLSVAFLTAAIAIEFSGPWMSAWWFVESIILYAVASKSSSRGFQVMGVIVYMLGLAKLFYYVFTYIRPIGYTLFFNGPFIMLAMSVGTAYAISFVYYHYGSISSEIRTRGISVFIIIANILTLYALTSQILAYYELQAMAGIMSSNIQNASNTSVSILWALYAAGVTVIGFAKSYVVVRRMGLVLFIITACKVVIDVWSLGEIYRIVSFIVFGVIALAISFLYVRYHDRLREIV